MNQPNKSTKQYILRTISEINPEVRADLERELNKRYFDKRIEALYFECLRRINEGESLQ